MIAFDKLSDRILKITIENTLEENDFRKLATQINPIILVKKNLRLLIDARHFEGWEDIKAAERHFQFVRDHHEKIERVAIVPAHTWQHWLASLADYFVKPDIRVFDTLDDARDWVQEGI